jgi:hypothetical protein
LPITRKELGKTGKKQETENIRFPKIRARKTRNNRERIKAKAEKKQRQSKEITKKEQRNAPHLLADYQPLNRTDWTPKKRKVT